MITPFDINDNTHEDTVFPTPFLTAPYNKVNVLEQNHHHQQQLLSSSSSLSHDGGVGGAGGVGGGGVETEQISQILTNEITQDFAQRIAMESQLGDTMKSR